MQIRGRVEPEASGKVHREPGRGRESIRGKKRKRAWGVPARYAQ